MAEVKDFKFQERPPAFLTSDQLDQRLDACRPQRLYVFVILAAHTGMRKSEVFNLRWSDVDFNRAELTVLQTKNNEYRIISMNELVRDTLKEHPRHITSELVMIHGDGTSYKRVDKAFHTALEKARLPRIRIHDLRHSFASNLVTAGVPLNVVKELLGHKDIKMTMVYAHLAPNAKRAAVELLLQDPQEEENIRPDEKTVSA